MRNDILYNHDMSANAKILLAVLWKHKSKMENTKTNKELGSLIGMDTKNVHHYIKELVRHKLIINCCEKGKKGKYGITYRPDLVKGDYTKMEYHFISRYPNDVIIDYFQLLNLYRIKANIEELTAVTLTQSKWLTIGEVVDTIIKLKRYHLVDFDLNLYFKFTNIENRINDERNEEADAMDAELKEEPAVTYQAGQKGIDETITSINYTGKDIIIFQEKILNPIDEKILNEFEDEFTEEDWMNLGMN